MDTNKVLGTILGGAIGDALGNPIEFMSLTEIRKEFGQRGLRDFPGTLHFTDDTQMSLFTAEGLLRAHAEDTDPIQEVEKSLFRWYWTQGSQSPKELSHLAEGVLWNEPKLHVARAPGGTCLSALQARIQAVVNGSTLPSPLNTSKGCGGVMRVAPCGLFAKTPQEARDLGCKTAGLTHQHPAGWDTAGIFAEIIWWLVQGAQIKDTIHQIYQVQKDDWHSDTREALGDALYLADLPECSAETVESLGGGWVAEEALAISIYCALKAQSFEHGVLLAVNHSGDSDSTGAITGNLLGAFWGVDSIPQTWRDRIELPQVLTFIGHLLTQKD